MKLIRRVKERNRMLKFLSALRRPVGENCLLKTKEDCIEYFNAILYIKEDIDNENKKIKWERVWYALWRGMAWAIVVSFVFLLFVYVDELFDTLERVWRWRINVGTILSWTWRDLDVSFLPTIWFMATFYLWKYALLNFCISIICTFFLHVK